MTKETVLTDDAIHNLVVDFEIECDCGIETYPVDNIVPFARAIEQAVFQSPEIQALRKDAKRYRHLRGGNQWIVAATQTGFHVDGEQLDELIDAEMEQQP